MHWYVVPVFLKVVGESTFFVPGTGAPVSAEAVLSASFIVHAHDPKAAPTTALLGSATALEPLPEGWVVQTVAEAQAHFEAVMGRAPTAQEVF